MARTGRPKASLVVSEAERAELVRGARAGSSTQAYALRCKIVLACADGASNVQVAAGVWGGPPAGGEGGEGFLRKRPGGGGGVGRGRPAPPALLPPGGGGGDVA